jgi:hypothetical protein
MTEQDYKTVDWNRNPNGTETITFWRDGMWWFGCTTRCATCKTVIIEKHKGCEKCNQLTD